MFGSCFKTLAVNLFFVVVFKAKCLLCSAEVYAYSAVWLLHGWCHVKLLPSRRTFTIIEATYVGCMYVLVYVTCHLHVWQNDRDLCCCGNVGVERIQKYASAQKAEPGEENVFAGNQTRDLSMMIRRSTTQLYPLE